MKHFLIFVLFFLGFQNVFLQEQKIAFQPLDVFSLEWASDPQISPDASQIIYKRNGFDIMKDNSKGNLWISTRQTILQGKRCELLEIHSPRHPKTLG